MLIEIWDYDFQMEVVNKTINLDRIKIKTINTSYIKYILHLNRELTEEDKKLLGKNFEIMNYYKVIMTDNAEFFIDCDDYMNIMKQTNGVKKE